MWYFQAKLLIFYKKKEYVDFLWKSLSVRKYGSMVEKWNHVGNIMRIDTVIRFDYECLFFNKKKRHSNWTNSEEKLESVKNDHVRHGSQLIKINQKWVSFEIIGHEKK